MRGEGVRTQEVAPRERAKKTAGNFEGPTRTTFPSRSPVPGFSLNGEASPERKKNQPGRALKRFSRGTDGRLGQLSETHLSSPKKFFRKRFQPAGNAFERFSRGIDGRLGQLSETHLSSPKKSTGKLLLSAKKTGRAEHSN